MTTVARSGATPHLSYKESGIPWIGPIPAHWLVTYLKYETHFINGAPFKPGEWSRQGTPIIRIENLNGDEDFNRYAGDLNTKFEVREGDLLFAWSGNVGTSFGPYIWNRPGLFYLNQHIFRLDSFRFHKRYFYWLLKAVTSFIESKASGIIGLVHVTKAELGRIPIPLIQRDEQLRIANFLDSKMAEIDRFVLKKRLQSELLEEDMEAIVNRAVMRGIDPDVPMKPSGFDWLGAIPKHWTVQRNVRLFRQRIETGRSDLPVLMVSLHTGVTVGEESDEDGRPRRLIEDRSTYKFAAQGDIAYNMMRMWQGAVGVVPIDGLVSPAYVVARPIHVETHSKYFTLLFRTKNYKNEINRNSRGIVSDRNRLYWDDFKQLESPVPPGAEQLQILDVVATEADRVDRAISTIKREIELIREFRAALIAEVISGKLDTRALSQKVEASTL
jgi:type I restriction enzyme S subunit